ncbi:hypothetical protein ACFQRB_14940 [Halobaculum litoreum]|uniref:Uncharacterized protein n=1 Tax=Halobaculum litoreum TaxID=3031998 RepID=A0ABD5XQH1_9EURY
MREYFASQAVRVTEGTTDSALSGYVVLSDEHDDEVLAAVDLRHLDGDLTAAPGEQGRSRRSSNTSTGRRSPPTTSGR